MAKRQRQKLAELNKVTKDLNEQKYRIYCECNHCDNGSYSIVRTGKFDKNNNQIFVCRDCDHEVKIGRLDFTKLEDAVGDLLSACDIIKMHLSPEDENIRKMCAQLQATMPKLLKSYSAVTKRVEQKKDARERHSSGAKASTYFGGATSSVYSNRSNSPRRR